MSSLSVAAIAMIIAPFVGSFLSVLVVRLPRGENVVWGRSQCRQCAKPLGPSELVPLLSWVLQRGKCAGCGASIDALYPGMELAATAVAMWAVMTVPQDLAVVTVLFGWVLLTLAVMDARSLFLSDSLTLPLVPAGLLVIGWVDPSALVAHAAGAGAGFALMIGVAWAYWKLRGREGLGLGDAKLMAGAGAWLGLSGLGSVLLIGVVVNAVFLALEHILGRPADKTTQVPLGMGLAAGMWLTWLYGPISLGA